MNRTISMSEYKYLGNLESCIVRSHKNLRTFRLDSIFEGDVPPHLSCDLCACRGSENNCDNQGSMYCWRPEGVALITDERAEL